MPVIPSRAAGPLSDISERSIDDFNRSRRTRFKLPKSHSRDRHYKTNSEPSSPERKMTHFEENFRSKSVMDRVATPHPTDGSQESLHHQKQSPHHDKRLVHIGFCYYYFSQLHIMRG